MKNGLYCGVREELGSAGVGGKAAVASAGLRSADGAPARVSEPDGEAVGRPEGPAGLRRRESV